MTTSASVDHSITRANIITDALMLVGALGPDDTASSNQTTHAARTLNNIVKSMSSYGISLWARKTGYILPVTDTNSVSLGPAGGHATLSYTQTTVSADASSGATTITVTSATGISNGYYIGLELTDGTMQWTTVNGAPSGTTVTLTAALTDDMDSGDYVYVYQTKLQRPLRIVEAFRHNQTGDTDTPIEVLSKSEYNHYGSKASASLPIALAYDPQLDHGVAFIYPQFSDGRDIITIIFQRPFEDFDATGDTPDFPQEWYDALTLALAVRIAPVYGLPTQDRGALRAEAKEALQQALGNEPEEGSFYIQPDVRW